MKYKVVPAPPESLDRVAEIQAALPVVPDEETACCVRLVRRAAIPSQDDAREWLTFLRAVELVEETARGYHRLRHQPTPEGLRAAFRDRIYLADDVLDTLESADDPMTADAVFDQLRDRLPRWEQQRYPDPSDVWRERVRRLLEWAVLLELADRTPDGYTVADR